MSQGIYRRDCAIVGLGETQLGRRPGWTAVEIQAEAIMLALADAGIDKSEVDGLFNLGPYSEPAVMFAATLGEYLRIDATVQTSIDAGGIHSPMLMIEHAIAAVQSGQCKVAVCAFGEPSATGKPVSGRGWTTTGRDIEFEEPFGIVGTVGPYAMLAARYMALYGTTVDDLAGVALSARRHALLNPNALMRKPLDMDTYLASRMISDPLRLLDCSPMVDGGGAVVVTSLERARDLPHPPVTLLGGAVRASHRNVGQFPDFDDLRLGDVTRRALERAQLSLDDVDVAMLHDAFTISTIIFLEELGFCGRGEAGAYIRAGNIDLGGACPVNTHGGLLSQGHAGGMLHVVEAVRQLRGDCGARQVEGAQISLLGGGGGLLGVNGVYLFGRP